MVEGEAASDLDGSGTVIANEDGTSWGGGLHGGILGLWGWCLDEPRP